MTIWRWVPRLRVSKVPVHLMLYGTLVLLPAAAQENSSDSTAPKAQSSDPSESRTAPAISNESSVAPAQRDAQTMGLRPQLSESVSHELTLDERLSIYRKSILSPTTVVSPALGAGIDQWQDEPTEWGQGMAGYGRRFGSAIGRNLANKSIIFGTAALDGEDPRYFSSDATGTFLRSKHALVSAFVSYREDGSRMPAYAHFAGAYGSSFLAMTWYPPSKSTAQHALVQGTTKIAMNAGMNLLREFWPDLKRRLHFGQ